MNEAGAIDRAAVRDGFADGKVAVLRGDWTDGDAELGRFIERHNRAGVPLYLWYAPGQAKARVLPQVLTPGMLAALLLVLVRTIAMFELTFLVAGPTSQTLVVSLYYAVFASGVRASQSIDAMAVVYMVTTLFWLILALRFVNPTQLVTRVKEEASE